MKKFNTFIYSLIASVFMIFLTGSIWLNNLERINAKDLRVTEWITFIFLMVVTVLLVVKTVLSDSYKKN
jgi:biotin transporter BioY